MSQQGGRPTGQEDDWWGQLYDDSTGDTGPTPAADSLDDRFASASGAVNDRPGPGPVVPSPRTGPDDTADLSRPPDPAPRRAPWEPPAARPAGPVTSPPEGRQEIPEPPQRPPLTPPAPLAPPAPPAHDPAPSVPPPRASAEPPAAPAPQAPPAPPTAGPAVEHRSTTAPAAPAAAPDIPRRPPGPPPAVPPQPAAPPSPERSPDSPGAQTAAAPPAPPGPPPAAPAARPYPPPPRTYVGSRPPTYDAEPTALPPADADGLDDLVPDTVLDGARYGSCTLRAASVRGDSARYRGEPRRDGLLTARFGTGDQALILVVVATGARATPGAHRAAAEACHWIARAVGRSHARLVDDIRAARRGDLKSGLHRLTGRSLGRLRAGAAEQGLRPEEYAATLRCLLLPADPTCRTRVFFGVGEGGLFRLRDGQWQDIEPQVAHVTGEPVMGFGSPPAQTPDGDRLTMDLGIPTPPSPYEPAPEPPPEPFRFRASVARPGDTLLMCSPGFAEPLRGEPELSAYLTERWSGSEPPGLAAFLADTQVRVKGYADDRTAAAVWEA
ncbi:protein phosphatase 2C domain-containing protein [Streptomyces sp. NPDC052682]|uniref:protein phosphatase 2C domain-containing protein n=1 Tax=Streptomyces sp. NPDC052682 TaxID=3154954 RepID=UPI003421ED1E